MKKSAINIFSSSIMCLSLMFILPFVGQSCKSTKEQQPVRSIVVSLKYNGKYWLGKPPLATVYFDLEASNPLPTFKWLLLPRFLGGRDISLDGVHSVGQRLGEAPQSPIVLVDVGGGLSGYYAIPLPGGSHIQLTNLEIGDYDWPNTKPSLKITYALTSAIHIANAELQAVLENASALQTNNFSGDFDKLHTGKHALMDNLKDSPTQYSDTSMHVLAIPLK